MTGKVGESTLKYTVFGFAALPAKSTAYKVMLWAPFSKPNKVRFPVRVWLSFPSRQYRI
jgi:hypothetical protein